VRLNERARAIADWCVAHAEELRISTHTLSNGARVIDAGIEATGGLGAGLKMAAICMGGLGETSFAPLTIGGTTWAGVQVWTDHPHVACMASQYAGWVVAPDGYFAMGSGPLRAHARVEQELFSKLGYAEDATHGVLVLETRTLPTADVAAWIAAKARLEPSALTLIAAPTASLAGGVQVVARVIETGLHKMEILGFDVRNVTSATGTAPLPPPARSDSRAIGRTNDCVLYGGQARYTVKGSDTELNQLAAALPASASPDYGTPFYEIFERYDKDFYRIDPHLFSPAEVWITNAISGRTYHAGRLNPDVLHASLFS
jgi:methenyltetrahydromethanopterin cyclohydrolase